MPDKYLISLSIIGTLVFALVVLLFVLFFVYTRKKLNQHFLEKQGLLIANLEEGERMMNQIAKEVHDNIGQISHLLYMTLDKIEKTPDKEGQTKLISQARQLTDMIISNADNVSNSLNSDYIKKRGLSNIIQDDIEHIRSTSKINCRFNLTGRIRSFHPDKELLIYRIAQEAMHNALKHAGASLLNISLFYADDSFTMKVKDNGSGFNIDNAKNKGIGLANMRERANLMNGELNITSMPDVGCAITLWVIDEPSKDIRQTEIVE